MSISSEKSRPRRHIRPPSRPFELQVADGVEDAEFRLAGPEELLVALRVKVRRVCAPDGLCAAVEKKVPVHGAARREEALFSLYGNGKRGAQQRRRAEGCRFQTQSLDHKDLAGVPVTERRRAVGGHADATRLAQQRPQRALWALQSRDAHGHGERLQKVVARDGLGVVPAAERIALLRVECNHALLQRRQRRAVGARDDAAEPRRIPARDRRLAEGGRRGAVVVRDEVVVGRVEVDAEEAPVLVAEDKVRDDGVPRFLGRVRRETVAEVGEEAVGDLISALLALRGGVVEDVFEDEGTELRVPQARVVARGQREREEMAALRVLRELVCVELKLAEVVAARRRLAEEPLHGLRGGKLELSQNASPNVFLDSR
ncbi:hypothetical protein M885DRAFT_508332 [Pelagophyceae sp. CCMP2097]|nr:hypothetical protein M885DRAFT_508332 [Pelagophyceae sp. CCMP2097]